LRGIPPRLSFASGVILSRVLSEKRAGCCSETKDIIVTLERMLQQQRHPLFKSLCWLWEEARTLPGAWLFPAEENGVSGFAGLAPILVIGEQPSLSPWPPGDKGRRCLYDALLACGAGQAHLTDIVKSRGGKGECTHWTQWPREQLQPHINLLRRELDELDPDRNAKLILLGDDARGLFSRHFPKHAASARVVPHFGALRWVRLENRGAWYTSFREKLSTALNS
jgi:hypothetical protein